MNNKLLLVPAAFLFALCGCKNNKSSKELIIGKTFKYSDTIIEKTDAIVSWLEQNKNNIKWADENELSDYARMEYTADGQIYDIELDKPKESVDAESIYEEMNTALKNVKNFEAISAIEIDFNEDGTGEFRIVESEHGQREIKMSGPITFTDLDGSKHGEGVEFSGTIKEEGKSESSSIYGSFVINEWKNNKITKTLLKYAPGEPENIISNEVEFKFPLTNNEDDYSIGGLINLLPANE